ncbi:MAG: hypothetical protein HYV15_03260 [Elusimicrobia bacterium]|nr:hypothetical protein [Elusimicrobiota bacterium]
MTAFLVIACVGVALEVAFTAATQPSVREGWRLKGQSYVWMFPIYGLAVPALDLLRPFAGAWPWPARGALYVLVLYAVEYLSGALLRRLTGRCPWDYGAARWAVHGLVRLDYAPAWLCAALLFERLYLLLRPL